MRSGSIYAAEHSAGVKPTSDAGAPRLACPVFLLVFHSGRKCVNDVQTTPRRHGATGLAALSLTVDLPPHGAFTPLAGQLTPHGGIIQRGSIRALVAK